MFAPVDYADELDQQDDQPTPPQPKPSPGAPSAASRRLDLLADLRPAPHDPHDFIQQSKNFIGFAQHALPEFLQLGDAGRSAGKQNGLANCLQPGKRDDFTSLQPSQPATLSLKQLTVEKSKRKLLKLLLKLKEEERAENAELPASLQLRKDCQLLARYVREEKLPYLVLRLHPADQGYSLHMRRAPEKPSSRSGGGNSSSNSSGAFNAAPPLPETVRLPYEQRDLLDYIDNEQLPPFLLDALDSNSDSDRYLDFFHHGKLFVEVQDCRRNAFPDCGRYESRFVALRPTTQSILNDLERLTGSAGVGAEPGCLGGARRSWNEQEKLELESRLVLATAEPVCLDPDPLVFLSTSALQYERKWFKTPRVRRQCEQRSLVRRNQVAKFNELPAPAGLELFDFLKRKAGEPVEEAARRRLEKQTENLVEPSLPPLDPASLASAAPLLEEVRRRARVIELPVRNDNSLTKLEEYLMEYMEPEKTPGSVTSISIYYRQIDDIYFGQLSVEKLPSPSSLAGAHRTLGEQLLSQKSSASGSSCLFQLGNKALTKKYIEQFIEIMSEHGRKAIRITTKKPGEPPRVNYTRKPAHLAAAAAAESFNQAKRLKPNGALVSRLQANGSGYAQYPAYAGNLPRPSPLAQPNSVSSGWLVSNGQPSDLGSMMQPPPSIPPSHSVSTPTQLPPPAPAALSNNLIANNPILNNLITNSTAGAASLLSAGSAPAPGMPHGESHRPSQSKQQPNAYAGANMIELPLRSGQIEATITPIPMVKPATIRPSANAPKPGETLAVFLTATNPLAGGGVAAHSAGSNEQLGTQSVMQITSTPTSSSAPAGHLSNGTALPTCVNISSLGMAKSPNLRLHNLVQLANVQSGAQCIALPISMMMTANVPATQVGTGLSSMEPPKKESASTVLLIDHSGAPAEVQSIHQLNQAGQMHHPGPANQMHQLNQVSPLSQNSQGSQAGATGLSPIGLAAGLNVHSLSSGISASSLAGHLHHHPQHHQYQPALSSASGTPDYAKATLLAKQSVGAAKFTGAGQLQIQMGGRSIQPEPNATTIQLSSASPMRLHLPKQHLQPHLLLHPQPPSAAPPVVCISPQLRKVNPK